MISKQDKPLTERLLKIAGWIYLFLGFGFLLLPIFSLVLFSFENKILKE